MSAQQRSLAEQELARTHARYRAELARVDVNDTNHANAVAYERACALLAGGIVWNDLSPTQWLLVVPGQWNGCNVGRFWEKLIGPYERNKGLFEAAVANRPTAREIYESARKKLEAKRAKRQRVD